METVKQAGRGQGFLQAFGAYGLWGVLVLYFALIRPTGPFETIGLRILLSVVVAGVALAVSGRWSAFLALVRRPRMIRTFGTAGLLIAGNWLAFVACVTTGNALEATLGYFINPLVAVVLGMVVLGERMRPLQWLAVVVALVAVTVLTVELGRVPWLSLVLALTFGFYGLVKKRVARDVPALEGLMLETTLIIPVGIACLVWAALRGGGLTIGTVSPLHTALLLSAGVVTTVPLVLYGAAARHLRLVELGLMQYLAPTIMFILAITVLGEVMPAERWIGFGLVWVGLVVFSVDAVRHGLRGRQVRRSAANGGAPARV